MSVRPVVSVVIPCYNQAEFLGDAIRSALEQTSAAVEIIVVDDGSTDDSVLVAAEFGDAIVVLRQHNQGLSVARNAGVLASRGELIQLLDSDDVLRANTLELSTKAALRTPACAVFAASWDELDVGGETIVHVEASPLPTDAFHALFDPIAVGPPCRYLIRRSAFARVGLFDADLRSCEDWDMWLRMASAGLQFASVPEACVGYRNHPTSMSKNFRRMWRSGNDVLDRASRIHGRCPDCRREHRRGINRWREWCYYSMLVPEVQALRRRRRHLAAAKVIARALVEDPSLLPLLTTFSRSRPDGKSP